jgi:hypothetical protein
VIKTVIPIPPLFSIFLDSGVAYIHTYDGLLPVFSDIFPIPGSIFDIGTVKPFNRFICRERTGLVSVLDKTCGRKAPLVNHYSGLRTY